MSEEQMQILQMVANGKISADEASLLLDAIAKADAKEQARQELEEEVDWPAMPVPPMPKMPKMIRYK